MAIIHSQPIQPEFNLANIKPPEIYGFFRTWFYQMGIRYFLLIVLGVNK